MKKTITVALLLALAGCQGNTAKQERDPLPYTKKRFAAEVEYELQPYLRKELDLPDATPLYACLGYSPDFASSELYPYVFHCIHDELKSAPNVFSANTAVAYWASGIDCGVRQYMIEKGDRIDLNKVPASYLKQCSEFKKLSIKHK